MIPEVLAIETVRAVADALARLTQSRAPHSVVGAGDIWICADRKPRLSNLVTSQGNALAAQQEMRALAKVIVAVLPGGKATSLPFATLLQRMAEGGHSGFSSWMNLVQA